MGGGGGGAVPSFMELESTYLRVQLLAESHELVEGEALSSSRQLAAKFHRHPFLQCIQLCMLVPAKLGYQRLELGKVGRELLLALFETVEFGAGGRGRVGVTEGGFENADDVVTVTQLESSILDEWEDLRLRLAFQAVKGITHSTTSPKGTSTPSPDCNPRRHTGVTSTVSGILLLHAESTPGTGGDFLCQ